jgi:dynactin complex subunit
MMEWHELVTVMAGFLATSFAILRLALNQHKNFLERFMGFFDDSLKRQTETIENLRSAVTSLSEGVRENSHLLQHVTEWLQVSTPVGRN